MVRQTLRGTTVISFGTTAMKSYRGGEIELNSDPNKDK